MALKAVLDTLDGVPTALHEFYTERDGKFYLDAEGVEDVSGLKSALERLKAEAKKAKDDAKKTAERYGDLDPDLAREALKKLQDAEDKQLLDDKKIDELIAKRTERMAQAHQKEIERFNKLVADLTSERDGLNGKLSEVLIDNAIRDVATRNSVRKTAIEDVLLRGKRLWRLRDGQPVPMNGEDVVYGKDPTKPISMDEWISGLQNDAPHLFEPSSGGGATGSSAGNRGGLRVVSGDNAIGMNLEAFAKGEATLAR